MAKQVHGGSWKVHGRFRGRPRKAGDPYLVLDRVERAGAIDEAAADVEEAA